MRRTPSPPRRPGPPWAAMLAVALLVSAGPASARADVRLPPGFTTHLYLTGQGFDPGRDARGIPATSTLVFDDAGRLYLGRTGRRYVSAETDDLFPLLRVPLGGGRIVAGAESPFLYGPPLRNPQVTAIRGGGELLVTTFDRERRIGVLYRMADGRAELLAGGTPPDGQQPVLRQPEGVAVAPSGELYVADRDADAVLRLDPRGRLLDRRYLAVRRPRVLAMDPAGTLWIGADGDAEAPWQQGTGEIWCVPREEPPRLVLRGPVPAALALGPGGHLFVADRHAPEVFVLTREGRRIPFGTYREGDAPRALAFAPDTPATRQAGIANDLFVATINLGAWPVNEVVRIAGPFEAFLRERAAAGP